MSNLEAIKQLIPLLSNKELAELNFIVYVEASERAAKKTGEEIEQLVKEALKK